MHPIAFEFGSLTVHWYGILTAIGFLAGFWTASRRGLLVGLGPEKIMDFAPWLMVGAMIGARTLYVISYWDKEFSGKPFFEIFMVQRGGLVFYGGFIGACLATIIYTRRKKIPIWKFADVLTPSLPLGHFFGRLGCLMTGCCFGKECSLPWAVHFPPEHQTKGLGVHPTQIYESILNLGLYFFLAWLFRRKKFDGQVFATYLICYAVLRSFVEIFRADYKPADYYLSGLLSPGQAVSVAIISAGVILFWKLPHLSKAKIENRG